MLAKLDGLEQVDDALYKEGMDVVKAVRKAVAA